MTYCYQPGHIRESSCSRQVIQRPTNKQCSEIERLSSTEPMGCLYQTFPSTLRNLCRREGTSHQCSDTVGGGHILGHCQLLLHYFHCHSLACDCFLESTASHPPASVSTLFCVFLLVAIETWAHFTPWSPCWLWILSYPIVIFIAALSVSLSKVKRSLQLGSWLSG